MDLFDATLLAQLHVNWPHRSEQIETLNLLLHPKILPSRCIHVYGRSGTGKTGVVRDILQSRKISHSYINYLDRANDRLSLLTLQRDLIHDEMLQSGTDTNSADQIQRHIAKSLLKCPLKKKDVPISKSSSKAEHEKQSSVVVTETEAETGTKTEAETGTKTEAEIDIETTKAREAVKSETTKPSISRKYISLYDVNALQSFLQQITALQYSSSPSVLFPNSEMSMSSSRMSSSFNTNIQTLLYLLGTIQHLPIRLSDVIHALRVHRLLISTQSLLQLSALGIFSSMTSTMKQKQRQKRDKKYPLSANTILKKKQTGNIGVQHTTTYINYKAIRSYPSEIQSIIHKNLQYCSTLGSNNSPHLNANANTNTGNNHNDDVKNNHNSTATFQQNLQKYCTSPFVIVFDNMNPMLYRSGAVDGGLDVFDGTNNSGSTSNTFDNVATSSSTNKSDGSSHTLTSNKGFYTNFDGIEPGPGHQVGQLQPGQPGQPGHPGQPGQSQFQSGPNTMSSLQLSLLGQNTNLGGGFTTMINLINPNPISSSLGGVSDLLANFVKLSEEIYRPITIVVISKSLWPTLAQLCGVEHCIPVHFQSYTESTLSHIITHQLIALDKPVKILLANSVWKKLQKIWKRENIVIHNFSTINNRNNGKNSGKNKSKDRKNITKIKESEANDRNDENDVDGNDKENSLTKESSTHLATDIDDIDDDEFSFAYISLGDIIHIQAFQTYVEMCVSVCYHGCRDLPELLRAIEYSCDKLLRFVLLYIYKNNAKMDNNIIEGSSTSTITDTNTITNTNANANINTSSTLPQNKPFLQSQSQLKPQTPSVFPLKALPPSILFNLRSITTKIVRNLYQPTMIVDQANDDEEYMKSHRLEIEQEKEREKEKEKEKERKNKEMEKKMEIEKQKTPESDFNTYHRVSNLTTDEILILENEGLNNLTNISKLLLVAAVLVSYLTPKEEHNAFIDDGPTFSKKRRRRGYQEKGDRISTISTSLLGPKPFSIQRLLSLYDTLTRNVIAPDVSTSLGFENPYSLKSFGIPSIVSNSLSNINTSVQEETSSSQFNFNSGIGLASFSRINTNAIVSNALISTEKIAQNSINIPHSQIFLPVLTPNPYRSLATVNNSNISLQSALHGMSLQKNDVLASMSNSLFIPLNDSLSIKNKMSINHVNSITKYPLTGFSTISKTSEISSIFGIHGSQQALKRSRSTSSTSRPRLGGYFADSNRGSTTITASDLLQLENFPPSITVPQSVSYDMLQSKIGELESLAFLINVTTSGRTKSERLGLGVQSSASQEAIGHTTNVARKNRYIVKISLPTAMVLSKSLGINLASYFD